MERVNKLISLIKTNKWIHYAIIIIIGVILSIPMCQIQIRDTHDGSLHFLRMLGTVNGIKTGQLPPIVAPYFCNGGGYAMNLFYNPLVTYIPLLIKLFTPSYMLALKIFAGLCIVLSGITMYQFVLNITKKRTISLFAAIIYMLAPYKLGDVYRRFAIGEFTAFVFMPILFTGLYNLFNQDGKKHYYIGIGATCLLLTHTVTTFYMAIIAAFYVLFNIKKLKEKEVIKKIAINVVFILLISLFFIVPMLEAKMSADYAIFDSEIMGTNGEYVYEHTLVPEQFFDDTVEEYADTVYSFGIPIFILLCLTVFTYKHVEKEYKDFYIISLFFALVSIYMSSRFCPWSILPDFFCKLQYPWRMLGFFNFFSSFVIGVNIYILLMKLCKKDLARLITVLILTIIMIIYTIPIMLQFKTEDPNIDQKYINSIMGNFTFNHMFINREYLPVKALEQQRTYLQDRNYKKIYMLSGYAQIKNTEIVDLTATANIVNCEENTILEFPFFFYPGYRITIEENGMIRDLKVEESKNGFVSTTIDKKIKDAKIKLEYVGTTITKISYVISLISTISFIIYIVIYTKQIKNNKKDNFDAKN